MMALLATLKDNFAVNDLATLWANSIGTVSISGGHCAIQADTSFSSALKSTNSYDLTGSSGGISISPYIATSSESKLIVQVNATNYIQIYQTGTSLIASIVQAGVTTTVATVTYDPVMHLWWRIREANGKIFFSTSADGIAWADLGKVAHSITITSVNLQVVCGDTGSDPAGTTYVNYVGPLVSYIDVYTYTYPTTYGIPASTPFPQQVLSIVIEILLNGTWTDISDYAYQRDGSVNIAITYGRPDESSQFQFSTCNLQLNNRGGVFSSKNASSPFYPYILRNTQIRVSMQSYYNSTYVYTYQFWGEVSEWPPSWDETANDIWVSISCNGIGRRLNQQSAIGSAMRRYYLQKSTSDPTYPVVYWPCEDGSNATQLAEVTGNSTAMTFTGSPNLSSDSSFGGSDPIPVLNNSEWTGSVPLYAPLTDLLFTTPGTYEIMPPAGSTQADVKLVAGGGGGGGSAPGALNGGGAAGGEYAEEANLTISDDITYTLIVGAGGKGGVASSGTNGGDSFFYKTVAGIRENLVSAMGGERGGTGFAGTGNGYASATIHHNGGSGYFNASGPAGGGGSSGGSLAAGNSATNATGAAAVSYGGPGGDSGGKDTGGTITPPPTNSYTKAYTCLHSYSYQGSDGGNPNQKISTDVNAQQGGDLVDTYNGMSKCWLLFDHSKIASDLSGATITKVTLTLKNLHSWFNSGMTVAFGWDTTTSFPSTKSDPTGAHIDIVEGTTSEFQTKTFGIDNDGSTFGAAFKSSGATSIVLFKSTNNLAYYGFFAGPKQSSPPVLTFYFTK
jgi:hypothetical protein